MQMILVLSLVDAEATADWFGAHPANSNQTALSSRQMKHVPYDWSMSDVAADPAFRRSALSQKHFQVHKWHLTRQREKVAREE